MDSTAKDFATFEVIESVEKEIKLLKIDLMELAETSPESDLMPRARAKVSDHGLNDAVRDADLRRWLGDCLLQIKPKSKGKRRGDKLDLTPVPWALDGLIVKGGMNMMIAEPKVGKTTLMLAMISAWHHGETTFLGKDLIGPCPPVIIVGTDQPEMDWARMLHAEGLMSDDGGLEDPVVALWSAADPLHFHEEGFTLLKEACQEHPGALVLCDSYYACVAPLGVEESSSSYANPLAQLLTVTAPHGATCVVIHHANKGIGGSIVSKSRGTTALTSIPSQNILLVPVASESNPNDRRIQVKTQGRAGRPETLLIERTEDGWICHGSGDEVLAEQQRTETVLNLPEKDAEVYAYIVERSELGFPVAQNEVYANRDFKLKQYQVSRICTRLVRAGLIYQDGRTEPGVLGGRPSPLFRASDAPSATTLSTQESHETSRAHIKSQFHAVQTQDALMQSGGLHADLFPAWNQPVEVQLSPGGPWTNGHVIRGVAPGNQLFVGLAGGDPEFRRAFPRSRIRPCQAKPATDQDVEPLPF